MITTSHWIFAVVALASGLLLGELSSRIARGTMSRPSRSSQVRDMARPVASFLFWSSTALGILIAAASGSRRALDELQSRTSEILPDLLLASLVLIGGYALSLVISVAVAQTALRASGVRHSGLERLIRWVILAGAVILALTQIGVDTTVLSLTMAVLAGVPALAIDRIGVLGRGAGVVGVAALHIEVGGAGIERDADHRGDLCWQIVEHIRCRRCRRVVSHGLASLLVHPRQVESDGPSDSRSSVKPSPNRPDSTDGR